MGITGDRYCGQYAGHTIELVRNNWDKTLQLLIDEQGVARESRILPHDITLTATFEANGVTHTVVATAVAHFPNSADSITVDGTPLSLTRIQ